MHIGTTLKIQLEGSQSRLTSELIGVDEGKYLIINMPPIQSMGNAASSIYKGGNIVIRYVHKGTVFGFKSRIIHFITTPVKLIFIDYPKKIENQNLRSHKRIDCHLPASATIADNTVKGPVTDLSKEGCLFTVKRVNIEKSVDHLQIDNEIIVSFQLPGVEEKLTITGKQKNIKKDKDSVHIGVSFSDMGIEVQEKLYDFLSTGEA
ncbi:MAG: flagellar brake protein [Candidatus Scalinduaceae bacterium]